MLFSSVMLNAKEGHYMYVDNLGVVVISTNKQLLSELFSGISFKGLVALATLSEIETLETDLHYLKPEIIIVDDSFEGTSAAKITQKLRISENCRELSRAVIVILSESRSADYVTYCYSCDCDYMMLKPVLGDSLWNRIAMVVAERVKEQEGKASELYLSSGLTDGSIKRLTAKLLYSLDCSPKNRGFSYLWDGIISIADHSVNFSVQGSDLYTVIATRHNQSSVNVRHSVHDMLKKIDKGKMKEYMDKYNLYDSFGDGTELLSSGIKFALFAAYVVTTQSEERENDKHDNRKKETKSINSGS